MIMKIIKCIQVFLLIFYTHIGYSQNTMDIHLNSGDVIYLSIDEIKNITFQDSSRICKIVILGSSTAEGRGPESADSAWVNRYRTYLKSLNINNEVVNLAVGGYTTYHIMADDYIPPSDRPSPSIGHNITKAISLNPTAIIINLPSNDVGREYSINEQLSNYRAVVNQVNNYNIPVWITTSQPCNYAEKYREALKTMRDSTFLIWGKYTIDFWNGISTSEGRIKEEFNVDGTHLNKDAHRIFFNRVVEKNISMW